VSEPRTVAAAVSAFAAVVLSATALAAQGVFDSVSTPKGYCHLWQMPPGGSDFPQDASYQRCALDRAPVLREAPSIPAPRFGRYASGSFLIVVNRDGTVNQHLTRDYTMGDDSVFHRHALETIRRWRFDRGVREGKPVRSAFEIEIVSNERDDTLPSRLEWRYSTGGERDTLSGMWIVEAPLPRFDAGQLDSIHAAVLRRLVRMRVLLPAAGTPYCVVLPGGDSAARAHVMAMIERAVPALAGVSRAPFGCERTVGTLRIVLPDVHRTENGRAVVYPSGDHLPNWPPGYEGQSWRAWKSRCVADLPARPPGSVGVDCAVEPVYSRQEYSEWSERRSHPVQGTPMPYADGDSVRVTIFATTREAYLTDTLHAVVRELPRLDAHAVRDRDSPCGGWSAHSQQGGELYVINGDPTSTSMYITAVTTGAAPPARAGPMRCGPQEPHTSEFAAFFLGDIGDKANTPVTLCFSECRRSYVLDPARHTLAERAHATFRRSDLRDDTRAGDQLMFRIVAESAPAGLVPLVLIRSGNRWPTVAWIARKVGENIWDYGVFGGGYPPDAEILIYFLVR
jgi:hypothetical protein